MTSARRLLIGIITMLTITGAHTARAERHVLVLIDITGSMTAIRGTGNPRFEDAKTDAKNFLNTLAGETEGLGLVAVYVFHNSLAEPRTFTSDPTNHFVSLTEARTAINGITTANGLTPLADSMCQTIDVLKNFGLPTDTRVLATFTDGGENNSVGDCHGPSTMILTTPEFDSGSWQNKVYNAATDAIPSISFYNNVFTFDESLTSHVNPESATLAALGRAPTSGSKLLDSLSDADFFSFLARDTHGAFHLIRDSDPLPAFGDVNNDFCVDRDDAILVARQFGQPSNLMFDLDGDGVIGFADYAIAASKIGQGCGQPDPYVPRNSVVCRESDEVVIDGQVIENVGVTIDAHGACKVTIRNSLIVSGQNAITILGAAQVAVDNSIIVGENAVITLRGVARLSAANSIFHGKTDVQGQIKFTDRGGNVFE